MTGQRPPAATDTARARHRFGPSVGLPEERLRSASCTACGASWLFDRRLAGSAAQCTCGHMVSVPMTAADRPPPPRPAPRPALSAAERYARSPRAVVRVGRGGALPVVYSDEHRREQGMLYDADHSVQTRWTNALLIELLLLMAALIVPSLLVDLLVTGASRSILAPVGSLLGGLLVLVVGLRAPAYAFGACTRFAPRHLAEALAVIPVLLLLAVAWLAVLRSAVPTVFDYDPVVEMLEQHHLVTVLFMIALVPGVFEEIAFRGLLQARLTALYGIGGGLLYTAVAFAMAHFITLGLPMHLLLGFYLCWLRVRSGSLWPPMLVHIGYNGGIVLLAWQGELL